MRTFETFLQTYRFYDGWDPLADILRPLAETLTGRPLPRIEFQARLHRHSIDGLRLAGNCSRLEDGPGYRIRLFQTPPNASLTPFRFMVLLHELGHAVHGETAPWCREFHQAETVLKSYDLSLLEIELWLLMDMSLSLDWMSFDQSTTHVQEAHAELYAYRLSRLLYEHFPCRFTKDLVWKSGFGITHHGVIALGALQGSGRVGSRGVLEVLSGIDLRDAYVNHVLASKATDPEVAKRVFSSWLTTFGEDIDLRQKKVGSRRASKSSMLEEGELRELTKVGGHLANVLERVDALKRITARLRATRIFSVIRARDVAGIRAHCLQAWKMYQSNPRARQMFDALCRRFSRAGEDDFARRLQREMLISLPSYVDGFFFTRIFNFPLSPTKKRTALLHWALYARPAECPAP